MTRPRAPPHADERVARRFDRAVESGYRRSWDESKAVQALRAEMKAAGVYVFLAGLDDSVPVFSVDASSGVPVFTDGPYAETKEHLGGFTVVDVADKEAARMWAGKSAAACGWPHEVRRAHTA